MIHFDEPFLTITWEPEDRIIRAEWKDEVGGEPMRRGLDAGLELIRQKQARRWLVDSRRLGAIDPADVKWVNDVWMPQAAAAGVSAMAFVLAQKIAMKLTMRAFIARIDEREVANAYFEDLAAARAWLRTQA
ncbi:MAG: STAS/SEC14 domain-containing protein [Myxococcales bacterium]|nr:STAS/SEC14 domain-containing protein [Myxococcales bacterium]